jgi:hypothetical protein
MSITQSLRVEPSAFIKNLAQLIVAADRLRLRPSFGLR